LIQGSVGFKIALSDDNWSFIHGSLRADYEIKPRIFCPLVEANLVVPIDSGIQFPGVNLTGADIIDTEASVWGWRIATDLTIHFRRGPFRRRKAGAAFVPPISIR
jgi:hypothetical protein